MLKFLFSIVALAGLAVIALFPGIAGAQDSETVLDGAQLMKMIENMGYTAKDLEDSPEKVKAEFSVSKSDLNVPIAAEVSASKRFVWLTVYFGEFDKLPNAEGRAAKMLKRNFKIQPSHFYVTEKGGLMIGMAIDNRNITPAILRQRIEKISSDVVDTKELWSTG